MNERLQVIKECDLIETIKKLSEGGRVNVDEVINDIQWLIEQAEKSGSVHSRWFMMDTITKQQKEIDELKFYIKAIEMNKDEEMQKLLENLGHE
jgi:hypothetical protein